MEQQMESLSLNAPVIADTPELVKFRLLPQKTQHLLLYEYPQLLATAMHQYSNGLDCELVLKGVLEGSSEMLKIRNFVGDAPISVALLNRQDSRADWLMRLAAQRNPEALGHRSQYLETLSMLSTSSIQAGEFIERLLVRDPTQLHRSYDCDGRNLLHHCALEESVNALEAVLKMAKQLLADGSLTAANVSAAVHMNDELGDTPMHLMAARNRSDMLALLVEFCEVSGIRVNLDERRHFGARWTPLMAAAAAGAADAVRFLLDHDADPGLEDQDGKTIPQLAAGQSGFAELFEPLFDSSELEAAGYSRGVSSLGECKSVDSGIQSCPAVEGTQVSKPTSPAGDNSEGLTPAEIAKLDEELRLGGQVEGFLEAMSHMNPSLRSKNLLPQTAKPVETAFSVWAHLSPVRREQVVEALKKIGAEFEI